MVEALDAKLTRKLAVIDERLARGGGARQGGAPKQGQRSRPPTATGGDARSPNPGVPAERSRSRGPTDGGGGEGRTKSAGGGPNGGAGGPNGGAGASRRAPREAGGGAGAAARNDPMAC